MSEWHQRPVEFYQCSLSIRTVERDLFIREDVAIETAAWIQQVRAQLQRIEHEREEVVQDQLLLGSE